jgi:hypothetical protein
MSVRIYLADVNETTLRSFGERALGTFPGKTHTRAEHQLPIEAK